MLAVGDISGKGISAALLMASVHAFVRAYSLEADTVLAPAPLGVGAVSYGNPGMYYWGDGSTQSQLAPGMLMTTLNYQLFRSTLPEKYATMFLGCYDATARELKYCNAGYLAPIMLMRATLCKKTTQVSGASSNGTQLAIAICERSRPMRTKTNLRAGTEYMKLGMENTSISGSPARAAKESSKHPRDLIVQCRYLS